ncbi:MAG: 16S rRNA (uracil(1498)-N(3))-methyltransferase [Planctomycetaceae bacterium]|nr:16S rRNA (uracil(1498)-N(3))-methyltransferase [Planctomycetaceae bacterium]
MTDRFFVDPAVSRWDGDAVWLAGDEFHHFSKVMRGKVGNALVLFDGTGKCARGIAESLHKDGLQIRITQTSADEIESTLRLTVASALPKGDRQRFLVEKLAELGAARFIPVQMERSVARANDAVVQRLRRYVIEAAKQCGRNVLMEIANEVPIGKLHEHLAMQTKYLLHPVALGNVGQTTSRQVLTGIPMPEKITILAGPEGSFTEQEVAIVLRAGFVPFDLGKRILRTETACIAAAAVFLSFAD